MKGDTEVIVAIIVGLLFFTLGVISEVGPIQFFVDFSFDGAGFFETLIMALATGLYSGFIVSSYFSYKDAFKKAGKLLGMLEEVSSVTYHGVDHFTLNAFKTGVISELETPFDSKTQLLSLSRELRDYVREYGAVFHISSWKPILKISEELATGFSDPNEAINWLEKSREELRKVQPGWLPVLLLRPFWPKSGKLKFV